MLQFIISAAHSIANKCSRGDLHCENIDPWALAKILGWLSVAAIVVALIAYLIATVGVPKAADFESPKSKPAAPDRENINQLKIASRKANALMATVIIITSTSCVIVLSFYAFQNHRSWFVASAPTLPSESDHGFEWARKYQVKKAECANAADPNFRQGCELYTGLIEDTITKPRLQDGHMWFGSYECESSCSGHLNGYYWAKSRKLEDMNECERGNSRSFREGCRQGVADYIVYSTLQQP